MCGTGSSVRKAMLNSASLDGLAPPGAVADAVGPGWRYVPADVSHSPTPIAMRTVESPGSHAACATRTSIWRRVVSTVAVGAGVSGLPLAASSSSALEPWTVRNSCAGETTLALCGHATGAPESPSATVNATLSGAFIVLSVIRNAVASLSGLTRNSTRSAALLAYVAVSAG